MKRGIFFLILFFLILFSGFISAIGVSPASKDFNFEPGLEAEIPYRVIANPGQEVEISVLGDLAQYVDVSKTEIVGPENFKVKFKLPDSIEPPGKHRIRVMVAQKIDEELVDFIGTSVRVISVIDVHVPYPGRYLETELRAKDVNMGEPVIFELDVKSQGNEDLDIAPRIEIFSQEGAKVGELNFNKRTIASQESIGLKKILDTTSYNPGNYKATAIIDYGALATSDAEFRIGSLNVNILNYTLVVPIGKLEKFDLTIQSDWNDNIDGAYAQVDFLNGSQMIESFKTTTTDLAAWEQKTITGYFDTMNFSEGTYDANITLFYFGKERGQTTNKEVKIIFFKRGSLEIWYFVGGGGIVLLIAVLLIKFFLLKHGKKKRKSRKK